MTKAITPATTTELDTWDDIVSGDWEVAETDIGEKIDWKVEPRFHGYYQGSSSVEMANDEGLFETVKFHQFKDGHGTLRFAWTTPRLDRGLAQCSVTCEVFIQWDGKEELANGHTINLFRIAFKTPEAVSISA